jgi:enoyl-CoA hydratase/carnithine racemase
MPALPQLKDAVLSLAERVAMLAFQRDDVRNALTGTDLASDLVATLAWANANLEVSVLIVTGEGSAFSAGGNIKTMGERSKAPPHELQQNYKHGIQRIPLAMQEAEIPVIAAVNGPAIGAGFDLANMCDIRIGSTTAQFGETFVNLGIIPGDGGAWFLQRLLGYQRAAELTFTGRIVEADEALALGILLELTEPDALIARAREIAAKIAAQPPLAVRYAKRLLKLAQQQPLAEHLDVCSSFQAICHKTEDHQEALAAFFEKRRGKFKGC